MPGWTHEAQANVCTLALPLLLVLPAGNAVDRYPRRHIAMAAHAVFSAAAVGLAAVSYFHGPVPAIYALLTVMGGARALISALRVGPDAPPTADAYIVNSQPANNFGALPNLNVGGGAATLLNFDLSVLPANTPASQVSKATKRRSRSILLRCRPMLRKWRSSALIPPTCSSFGIGSAGAIRWIRRSAFQQ